MVPVIKYQDYLDLVNSQGGEEKDDCLHKDCNKSDHVVPAVFLIIVFTTALILSILIIATIGSSITLRRFGISLKIEVYLKPPLSSVNSFDFCRSPFNILLMNISIVSLLECLSNMTMSIVYLMTMPWRFGIYMCYLNASFFEAVPLIHTVLLLTVLVDRTVYVKNPYR